MISRIVIIEDEKPNADRLTRLLRNLLPVVEILAVIESVKDSVEWFNSNVHPDLVLMDIRLSDGLSFGIFGLTTIKCPVVFTTAYDEYALLAFKNNGVDYLLKPIEIEELEKALNKTNALTQPTYDGAALEKIIDQLRPKNFRNKFLLPFKDGFKVVIANDIIYIAFEHRIATAFMANGKQVVLQHTMDELEQQLDPRIFFRANRQFIIHIDAVSQILNYFNGKLKVILKNSQAEIIVSRERSTGLKSWISF